MKAIVARRLGGPEVLGLEQWPEPRPGPGEVRIRVVMAGVNFADTERRRGLHQAVGLPWIPGLEAAGFVDEIGKNVDASLVGRRVAFMATATYAEATIVDAGALLLLPDSVGWEEAAAFPVQGLTAYHLLHAAARLGAGESVLVHAAAGGVGSWCVQMAARAGARVFGTCSRPEKAAAVRALGAEAVFLYGPNLAAIVREHTGGRGVDVVLDSVGRDTQETSLAVLAPFGRLIYFGEASGSPAPVDVGRLYEKSLQVGAYWLRTPHPRQLGREAAATLLEGLASGSLRAPAVRVFPLANAGEAHRALESRTTEGKLLLRVG